ncbi:DUF397 domain-containing protein [Streptomyces sp. NPDC001339]|uniref:DUF397 domain-containing protein n=1 Tax=Streptomyces sp. NPDC001339 TaxID=3364563 RepID=UPI0036B2561D
MTSASTLPVRWRKSSYSSTNGGECIEIGEGITGIVPVRDSKDPNGPALTFKTGAWSSFVSVIKGGKFPG